MKNKTIYTKPVFLMKRKNTRNCGVGRCNSPVFTHGISLSKTDTPLTTEWYVCGLPDEWENELIKLPTGPYKISYTSRLKEDRGLYYFGKRKAYVIAKLDRIEYYPLGWFLIIGVQAKHLWRSLRWYTRMRVRNLFRTEAV